jgi:hypothetical protein
LGTREVLAENWARPALSCPRLWTAEKKKKIGANLKLQFGKPDRRDLLADVEGGLLRKGGLEIRVPGK